LAKAEWNNSGSSWLTRSFANDPQFTFYTFTQDSSRVHQFTLIHCLPLLLVQIKQVERVNGSNVRILTEIVCNLFLENSVFDSLDNEGISPFYYAIHFGSHDYLTTYLSIYSQNMIPPNCTDHDWFKETNSYSFDEAISDMERRIEWDNNPRRKESTGQTKTTMVDPMIALVRDCKLLNHFPVYIFFHHRLDAAIRGFSNLNVSKIEHALRTGARDFELPMLKLLDGFFCRIGLLSMYATGDFSAEYAALSVSNSVVRDESWAIKAALQHFKNALVGERNERSLIVQASCFDGETLQNATRTFHRLFQILRPDWSSLESEPLSRARFQCLDWLLSKSRETRTISRYRQYLSEGQINDAFIATEKIFDGSMQQSDLRVLNHKITLTLFQDYSPYGLGLQTAGTWMVLSSLSQIRTMDENRSLSQKSLYHRFLTCARALLVRRRLVAHLYPGEGHQQDVDNMQRMYDLYQRVMDLSPGIPSCISWMLENAFFDVVREF
jgi:hypothetical protein